MSKLSSNTSRFSTGSLPPVPSYVQFGKELWTGVKEVGAATVVFVFTVEVFVTVVVTLDLEFAVRSLPSAAY